MAGGVRNEATQIALSPPSTSAFPHLASQLRIGPMEIRNRIVQLPHGVSFTEMGDLRPTRRHAAYYQRRAAGGVGFMIMESSVASLDGRARFPLTLSSDPLNVEGYRAIAEAVHREGARMRGQITHYGNQASSTVTRRPLIAPSTLGDPIVRESSRAMTQADMARVRDDFTTAARNFVSAGFDAVELKLAHDGLLRQFMSPLTNDRVDSYGGSTQSRLRFPLEVLEAVRQAIGSTAALGVRLVVDECFDGGYGLGLESALGISRANSAVHEVQSVVRRQRPRVSSDQLHSQPVGRSRRAVPRSRR